MATSSTLICPVCHTRRAAAGGKGPILGGHALPYGVPCPGSGTAGLTGAAARKALQELPDYDAWPDMPQITTGRTPWLSPSAKDGVSWLVRLGWYAGLGTAGLFALACFLVLLVLLLLFVAGVLVL